MNALTNFPTNLELQQAYECNSSACNFDKTPTPSILAFEVWLLLSVAIFVFFVRKRTKHLFLRLAVIAIAVLIFEVFTSPMWNNYKLGWWAYFYRDVSWVLTIGWTGLFFGVTHFIDELFPKIGRLKQFLLYLLTTTFVIIPVEILIITLNIRSYSPEVQGSLSGRALGVLPLEAFFYIAVFSSLVLGFYKYWELGIEKKLLTPVLRLNLLRNAVISIVAVVLYEITIEPMAVNVNFPSWSYVYNDLTFIMTGLWIGIIWLSLTIVNRFFVQLSLFQKFLGYVWLATFFSLPMEAWFIKNGFRLYGPSSVANFSGIEIPGTGIPLELLFAVPAYLSLVIAFIQYWQIVWDNSDV